MLETELKAASEFALEAGKILMEIYSTDFDVEYKGKANPVTEADKRANAYLVKALRETFPSDGVVAEETADQSDALKGGRCWYVDPLDGTKEFIAKNGEFAVMLGLAIDGESTLGVVYQPEFDKLYTGVVGQGAQLKQKGDTRELKVSDVADPNQLSLVVSRSHRSQNVDKIVTGLGIQNETRSGSVGLKIGIIAEQRADLYVNVSSKTCAWDACGPEAILRAAGGTFADLGGKPFRYGGEDMHNVRGILACNTAAFDSVVPVIAQVGSEAGLL